MLWHIACRLLICWYSQCKSCRNREGRWGGGGTMVGAGCVCVWEGGVVGRRLHQDCIRHRIVQLLPSMPSTTLWHNNEFHFQLHFLLFMVEDTHGNAVMTPPAAELKGLFVAFVLTIYIFTYSYLKKAHIMCVSFCLDYFTFNWASTVTQSNAWCSTKTSQSFTVFATKPTISKLPHPAPVLSAGQSRYSPLPILWWTVS